MGSVDQQYICKYTLSLTVAGYSTGCELCERHLIRTRDSVVQFIFCWLGGPIWIDPHTIIYVNFYHPMVDTRFASL